MAKDLKADNHLQLFCANAISPSTNEAYLTYVYFGPMFRQKIYYFSRSDWRLLKVSTNAGFAIDSPGVPRIVCASDQIRILWVIAVNV